MNDYEDYDPDIDGPITTRPRHWRQIAAGGGTLVGDAIQRDAVAPSRRNISFGMQPDEADILYAAVKADGVTLATFMRRIVKDAFARRGVDVEREMPALCRATQFGDLRLNSTPRHLLVRR